MLKEVHSLPSLSPTFFFTARLELKQIEEKQKIQNKRFKLPHYSWLLGEEPFSDVYMGWRSEGLTMIFDVHIPFTESRYPLFEDGDSLELFIDTRATKDATYASRFCHHFLILPTPVQGVRAMEITHLRLSDTRPLSDAEEIDIKVEFGKRGYSLKVDLPASCLYGYDPQISRQLGFTYRLNRALGPPQHFVVSSQSCQIAQYPALWASMRLQ